MTSLEKASGYTLPTATQKNAFFCNSVPTFFCDSDLMKFLDYAKERKGNTRICLHRSPNCSLHEMIIFQRKECFYPPKKNLEKEKSFMILYGRMEVIIFGPNGEIKDSVCLSQEKNSYCRIPKGIMHVDLPQDESLHLEITSGPFKSEDNIVAEWFDDSKKRMLLNRRI